MDPQIASLCTVPAVHGGHGDQGAGEVHHQPGAGAGLHGERHRPCAVHHLQLVPAVQVFWLELYHVHYFFLFKEFK